MTGRVSAVRSEPERPLSWTGRIGLIAFVVVGLAIAAPTGLSLLWFIPYAGVGAILAVRRPRTSIGWILLGLAASFAFLGAELDATVQQFAEGSVAPGAAIFAIAIDKAGLVLFLLLATLAIVFPTGRLPAGRWGTASRLALGGGLVLLGATMVMPTIRVGLVGQPDSVTVQNPLALLPDLAIWQVLRLETTTFVPVLMVLGAAAISLVVRARRSVGIERQQFRWFAAAIGVVAIAVIGPLLLAFVFPGLENGAIWFPAMATIVLVPIAIGIAVLRYRLYEIDRLISRTIGWAVVTGVLVGTFALLVLLLTRVLEPLTGEDTLAVAGSTLVVAALFQPLRRRVQVAVDRRFDRARYDGGIASAAFAERLRDDIDLASLTTELGAVVIRTVAPRGQGVWLRHP